MKLSLNKIKCIFIYTTLFILFFTIHVSIYAAQGVPTTLSYQGKLTDSGGNPLGAGGTDYYFKFSIWDNPTPGQGIKLWPTSSPNSTILNVKQGSFGVNVGDTDGGYPDVLDYNFNTNNKVYLQVEVSGDNTTFETLAPRSLISSNAFSQVANSVNGTADSSFGTSTPFLNTLISVLSTNINKAVMTIKGAVGQVANLFNVKDSNDNSLFTVTADGKVGVGTSTPGARLHVLSTTNQLQLGYDGNNYLSVKVDSVGTTVYDTTGSGAKEHIFKVGGTSMLSIRNGFISPSASIVGYSAGAFDIGSSAKPHGNLYTQSVIASGNVGIGTTTPGSKLDVWGNLNVGTSSTSVLFVNTTNNFVGIGTNNPTKQLTIAGADNDQQIFLTNSNGWASNRSVGIAFGNTSNTLVVPYSSNALWTTYYGMAFKRGASGNINLVTGTNNSDDVALGGIITPSSLAGATMVVKADGNVGIGTTTPSAKLEIKIASSTTKGLVLQGATSQSVSLQEWQNSAGTAVTSINNSGYLTWASGQGSLGSSGSIYTYGGVYGNQSRFGMNTGGLAVSNIGNGYQFFNANDITIGSPTATIRQESVGVLQINNGTVGVYSDLKLRNLISEGNIGIGTTTPTEKLSVIGNGQFTAVGSGAYAFDLNLTANGVLTTSASDERLKENIMTISSTSTLEKLSMLRSVSFDWKTNGSHDIGLIAQEVEQIFPELVFVNPTDGYKGVNYSRFTALLISAIKELSTRVSSFFDGTAKIKVKELCIEDVCVTKQQLEQMMQNQNVQPVVIINNTSTTSEPVTETLPEVIEPQPTEPVVVETVTPEPTIPELTLSETVIIEN